MTATTNMVFSESTNKTGMYEMFQDLTSTNPNSYSIYKFARDCNNSLLAYKALADGNSATYQFDDSNQTATAEISRDLVLGTYQYLVTVDDATSANQVTEIERVEMANSSSGTAFNVLYPYDEMDSDESIVFRRTISGVPSQYYKRDNYIFLDVKPNFNCRLVQEGIAGFRIFIKRTMTYFAGTDTTKVAGIPHAHQEFVVYRAVYLYCVANLPDQASGYLAILNGIIKDIKKYYAERDKDSHRKISTAEINFM